MTGRGHEARRQRRGENVPPGCPTSKQIMKRIAVLTSGGDAPGMNAAIRAVVRTGLYRGWEIFGVRQGCAGPIVGERTPLTAPDVGAILQQGGTFLGTPRSPECERESGREKALVHLADRGIDALVVIGGGGSQTGGHKKFQTELRGVGVRMTLRTARDG